MRLAQPGAWLIALIKPQFEVGRAHVGKGGIVRDAAAREAAVARVGATISAQPGWHPIGTVTSPITGGDGNVEVLIGARLDGAGDDR
jgi:23S rRNA (cytidine1920-2'-O)/16S rRNA (cytidine1409-2'-O)-methyltransferase